MHKVALVLYVEVGEVRALTVPQNHVVVGACVRAAVVVAHRGAALVGVDAFYVGRDSVRRSVLDRRLLLNFGHVARHEESVFFLAQTALVFVEIYVVILEFVRVGGWARSLHSNGGAGAWV